MDLLFLIGLLVRSLEYLVGDVGDTESSSISSVGRIFWGMAFTFAIIKTIKIGIVSKYFGPIILSINAMMKDVFMFLITFLVIMLAFSCGVSYMFNYLSDGKASSTIRIFKYFFWVMLQPFRANPDYDKVADLPYDTECLTSLAAQSSEINVNSIAKCRLETMYNTTCMASKILSLAPAKPTRGDMASCVISRRLGAENLQSAVVPMWVVYQFLVSVVLLRILIVMMTITYRKIYDNLDTQWKYARLYNIIQFFDQDSLLPPPFTFLTLIMYCVRFFAKSKCLKKGKLENNYNARNQCRQIDIEYSTLIFSFLDNVKPKPDKPKSEKKK